MGGAPGAAVLHSLRSPASAARLTPLDQIDVPAPRPDELYELEWHGRKFAFQGLKALLGAADYAKSGDRNAGLSASSDLSREAARKILSGLTVQHLFEHPPTTAAGTVDSVTRVNYDIDKARYCEISHLTMGQLKNKLLRESPEKLAGLGSALTGMMAAGLAKLMDVHELLHVSAKFHHPTQARTYLGLPNTLSSRLQPNHPVDDLDGIKLLTYQGLSMASGDALIGVNPGIDTVENVSKVLRHLDQLRRETGAPTQICVLGHINTQLNCLKQGAPVEIMFQSLAGTEATNVQEFGVSVDLLDEAYRTMKELGPLKDEARQFMYFETGQGSAFSYGKHEGMDMCTAEAMTYGLARRYDPFMVNNVTGFIGPETHADDQQLVLSNLQDLFMGKLMGLPIGMAPCYTLHAGATLEGQQIATQLLANGGATYYMDVYQNTDRMLAYFDTSAHDNQTLREVHGRTPTPEFARWALGRGILQREPDGTLGRGPLWGKPEQFCAPGEMERLKAATPALFGFENAGPRPDEEASRAARLSQAEARDAVHKELDLDLVNRAVPCRLVATQAATKAAHLNNPALGAQLASSLPKEGNDVQFLISDGLSAPAVETNIERLFPSIQGGMGDFKQGQPILAPLGRVKLAEDVARATDSKLTVVLIGERPGAEAPNSLSAYFAYRLDPESQEAAARYSGDPKIEFEYSVLSNIHDGGLPPEQAGQAIAARIHEILTHRANGNRLEATLHG